jgi:hypothetical protein
LAAQQLYENPNMLVEAGCQHYWNELIDGSFILFYFILFFFFGRILFGSLDACGCFNPIF